MDDNQDSQSLNFSIGYMQIDNQSEPEPIFPVMIRPRELYYINGTIQVKLKDQDKKDTDNHKIEDVENAKMFQLQLLINKKSNTFNNVIYIDNLMFLM
jgi:hypothetical protein